MQPVFSTRPVELEGVMSSLSCAAAVRRLYRQFWLLLHGPTDLIYTNIQPLRHFFRSKVKVKD